MDEKAKIQQYVVDFLEFEGQNGQADQDEKQDIVVDTTDGSEWNAHYLEKLDVAKELEKDKSKFRLESITDGAAVTDSADADAALATTIGTASTAAAAAKTIRVPTKGSTSEKHDMAFSNNCTIPPVASLPRYDDEEGEAGMSLSSILLSPSPRANTSTSTSTSTSTNDSDKKLPPSRLSTTSRQQQQQLLLQQQRGAVSMACLPTNRSDKETAPPTTNLRATISMPGAIAINGSRARLRTLNVDCFHDSELQSSFFRTTSTKRMEESTHFCQVEATPVEADVITELEIAKKERELLQKRLDEMEQAQTRNSHVSCCEVVADLVSVASPVPHPDEGEKQQHQHQHQHDRRSRLEHVPSGIFQQRPMPFFMGSSFLTLGDESTATTTVNTKRYRCVGIIFAIACIAIMTTFVTIVLVRKITHSDIASVIPNLPPLDIEPSLLQPVLYSIKERGFLRCRADPLEVSHDQGFSLDLCFAIAAAIFGTPDLDSLQDHVEFSNISWGDKFTSLWDGSVDVLSSYVTDNMKREVYDDTTGRGMLFSTPYFYSGMLYVGIPKYVDCAERQDTLTGDCSNLSICVRQFSTLQDLVETLLPGVTTSYLVDDTKESFEHFVNGDCNVIAGEPLYVYEERARAEGYNGDFSVSSKLYSNEPLALASRGDDVEWADFCNWVVQAIITAEYLNITQDMALPSSSSTSAWSTVIGDELEEVTETLFGAEYRSMFQNIVAAVGNYGEMYERNLESKVPRGENRINGINDGTSGLFYALPFGDLSFDKTLSKPGPTPGGTLESIINRGVLRCGIVHENISTDSEQDYDTEDDNSTKNESMQQAILNLDKAYCRAVAAALFQFSATNDDEHGVILLEFSTADGGYAALDQDDVDVLAGGILSVTNDIVEETTGSGFTFTPPYFFFDSTYGNDSTRKTSKGIGLSLATRQSDPQWSAFVKWITVALVFAEEYEITQQSAQKMPSVELFGTKFWQMLRHAVLAVGSYAELYDRIFIQKSPHLNFTRSGRNLLNGDSGPQIAPMPLL